MSPGDTKTVPRRLYKADVNPDSDYRQWATLKQSTVDRCTSDTQLQLHNEDANGVTCEPQREEQTAVAEEPSQEVGEDNLELMQPIQGAQNSFQTQNVDQDPPPESPQSIHSVHT